MAPTGVSDDCYTNIYHRGQVRQPSPIVALGSSGGGGSSYSNYTSALQAQSDIMSQEQRKEDNRQLKIAAELLLYQWDVKVNPQRHIEQSMRIYQCPNHGPIEITEEEYHRGADLCFKCKRDRSGGLVFCSQCRMPRKEGERCASCARGEDKWFYNYNLNPWQVEELKSPLFKPPFSKSDRNQRAVFWEKYTKVGKSLFNEFKV